MVKVALLVRGVSNDQVVVRGLVQVVYCTQWVATWSPARLFLLAELVEILVLCWNELLLGRLEWTWLVLLFDAQSFLC